MVGSATKDRLWRALSVTEVQHEQFLKDGLELTAPFVWVQLCLSEEKCVVLLGCSCGSTCLLCLAMRSTAVTDFSTSLMPAVGPRKCGFPRLNTSIGCTLCVAQCLWASLLRYKVYKNELWGVSGCWPFCGDKMHCLDKASSPKRMFEGELAAILSWTVFSAYMW